MKIRRLLLGILLPSLALLATASPLRASGPDASLLVRIPVDALDQPAGPGDWADIWVVEREEGWALLAADPGDLLRLAGERIPYQIDWEETSRADTRSVDLTCYASVEQIEKELLDYAKKYPGLVDVIDYGDSWEKVQSGGAGGHDLLMVRVSDHATDGRPKPNYFLMSTIHARELATAEISREFLRRLLEGYGKDPAITALVRETAFYVAPMTNPDGHKKAETGSLWRKNTNNTNGCSVNGKLGTDLNRNSSYMWNHGGASADPCDETYHGPSATSEPEVAAIENFFPVMWPARPDSSDKIPADEENTQGMMITLHSYSQWILRPLGYKKQASMNEAPLKAMGDRFGAFTGYRSGIASIALYIASGCTDDVAYGVYGVPAFTFEVGDAFFEDCGKIPKVVHDSVEALLYAARIARQPYKLVFGPDVALASQSSATLAPGGTVTFTVGAIQKSSSAIVERIEATIDEPVWRGANTLALVPVDGEFDSLSETATLTLEAAGLRPGKHTVWFEAYGADGQAGPTTAAEFTIIRAELENENAE